tara:strand:- start:1366 stop:2988 length:1623 start_codon:yes stop_codon:yes gene_type:complete
MGSVNLDNTGSGSAITLSSDGTDLLLDGTAIGGGGGGADLYAAETTGSSDPTASGTLSIAIGSGATSAGLRAVSIGRGATAAGQDNVAIGSSAAVNSGASKGIAIQGNVSGGGGAGSIAIDGTTTANGTVAIGRNVYIQAQYSVALGYNSKIRATASYGTALGYNAIAYGSGSTALTNTYAAGADSFAAAITNNTTSYGASSTRAISIGAFSQASGSQDAISIGYSSIGSANKTTAVGYRTQATNANAVALGSHARATGHYSLAISSATGDSTGALSSGVSSIAIGSTATASHQHSAVLGNDVQSTATNQVNIGGSTQDVRISETYTLPKVDGSANEVLTTDGSGAVSWAAAGGGGSYTLLSTATVSSTVSELIVALSGTYQEYRIVVQNWISDATNGGNDIMMRAGTDASTFASGSTDYTHALRYTRIGSSGAADGSHTNAGKNFLQLSNYAIDGTVSKGGLYMNMGITNPHSTTYPTAFHWNMNHGSETGGTNAINNVVGSGLLLTTIANTTHLRFSFAGSGTANQFSAGVFKVYGVS